MELIKKCYASNTKFGISLSGTSLLFTHPASSLVRSIVRLVTLLRQNSELQDIFSNIATAKSSFEATTSGLSKLQFLSF